MLLGIDLQCQNIGSIDEGDHYIKFHLNNKADEFKWALVLVYGRTQDDRKENLLAELVHMCSHENLPLLISGDYNILRQSSEKIMIASMVDGHSCLMSSLTILTSRS
jgi:hypothetical protein